MKYENIIIKRIKKVVIIELNRPQFLNALCDKLISELNQALNEIEKDDTVSVVVLTGSEKAFAAGADISEMYDKEFIELLKDDFILPWERLSKFKKHNAALQCGDWKTAAVEGRDSRWYKQVTNRAERLMSRLEEV